MLRAIIFDFNGVIIDDEPLHFFAFQEILKKEGIRLTRKTYFKHYLAYDDRTCITRILKDRGQEPSRPEILRLRKAKERAYRRLLKTRLRLFPGTVNLIRDCAAHYPLAIASGALRTEIFSILKKFQLKKYFKVVVSADDVVNGKPHPETFIRALQLLNRGRAPRGEKIRANECLVIEDAFQGIVAAHQAGMKCMAVAHSYPVRQLVQADASVQRIRDLRLSKLEALFKAAQ